MLFFTGTLLEFAVSGTKVIGGTSLEDMVSKLKKPRRVMLLVKAGSAVDAFVDKLVSIPSACMQLIFPDETKPWLSFGLHGLLFPLSFRHINEANLWVLAGLCVMPWLICYCLLMSCCPRGLICVFSL